MNKKMALFLSTSFFMAGSTLALDEEYQRQHWQADKAFKEMEGGGSSANTIDQEKMLAQMIKMKKIIEKLKENNAELKNTVATQKEQISSLEEKNSSLTKKIASGMLVSDSTNPQISSASKSSADWQFATSSNVIEWLYQNSDAVFGESGAYGLKINKLSAASNKIYLRAQTFSDNFNREDCLVRCTLSDDKRNSYDVLNTAVGRVQAEAKNKEIVVNCPAPKADAEKITIRLSNATSKTRKARCGSKDWHDLPEFDLQLLANNS